MNPQSPNPKSHKRWTTEHDAAITRLAVAARRIEECHTTEIRAELFNAVEAAREMGIGWTKIGDTLGIASGNASGNAYQRYRRRPDTSGGRHPRACYDTPHHRGTGEPDC